MLGGVPFPLSSASSSASRSPSISRPSMMPRMAGTSSRVWFVTGIQWASVSTAAVADSNVSADSGLALVALGVVALNVVDSETNAALLVKASSRKNWITGEPVCRLRNADRTVRSGRSGV
jgi:hypothetical protein